MTEPTTILLIPSSDHTGLLAGGPYGARPPLMYDYNVCSAPPDHDPKCNICRRKWTPGPVPADDLACALVLANDNLPNRWGVLMAAQSAPGVHSDDIHSLTVRIERLVWKALTRRAIGLQAFVDARYPGCTLAYLGADRAVLNAPSIS